MPTDGPIEIGWFGLAVGATLLVANGLVSMWLGLGLGRKLLVAGLRTVVQLSLLGLVLVQVFESGNAWLVGGICFLMILMAAHEAVSRAGRTYRGARRDVFLSLLVAAGTSMVFVTTLVLRTEPWWTPR
jgi:putative ABC transport system permease protein